jgi:membrane associated rhomboid family serine protease
MAEVELNVVCKHCGAEVSPYITECPYCGNRLRKRAPKLESRGKELAPKERHGLLGRLRRTRASDRERPLAWLVTERPYGTIALLAGTAVVYLVNQATTLSDYDLGAIAGPLNGDWWRLLASQFAYDNLGYLLAVGVAVAIFGTSLERRYGTLVMLALFLASGAAGMYLATVAETLPIAFGGNGSALGLICAWAVLDLRARRSGIDIESDLLGVAVIAAVVALMPLADDSASWWAALGGAAIGGLVGLLMPQRR